MNIEELIETLDFDEYDYFYHETSLNNGEKIMEEGLLVDGTNILDTKNILFTTASPLTQELASTPNDFIDFLTQEKSHLAIRDISEMVIMCAPKDYHMQLVRPYQNYDQNGNYYEGIIENNFIMGYINLDDLNFNPNPDFEFIDDYTPRK